MDPIGFRTDPGLRYRINKALDDVTQALGRHTLVVFVDDLDRCPSDKILSVLEAINYLSSNPRQSFIILGMALDKTLPAISTEFAAVVEEEFKELPQRANRRVALKENCCNSRATRAIPSLDATPSGTPVSDNDANHSYQSDGDAAEQDPHRGRVR